MAAIQTDYSRLEAAISERHSAISLANNICALESSGYTREAIKAQHNAITSLGNRLWETALYGGSRAEVINIMNGAVIFCSTQFAGEEVTMRRYEYHYLADHVAAHKRLLTQIVGVRRNAAGEGLSLAVLELSAMLDTYHEHVNAWDLPFGYSLHSAIQSASAGAV